MSDALNTRPEGRAAESIAARTLQPIVLSTDDVEERHREDMWRSLYDRFNTLRRLDDADSNGSFVARNEIWHLGPLAMMRNAAPPIWFDRSARHIRRDAIDHWVIRVAHSGSSRIRYGEISLATRPGVPLLFTLGEPFEGKRTAADWLSLYLPRDSFPELSAGLSVRSPCLLDTPGGALLADWMLLLERRMSTLTAEHVPMLVDATRSMVRACVLGAVPHAVSPSDSAVAQRERIRRTMIANITSPTLSPTKLSQLTGVSRAQLYRIFEAEGGVACHIQRLRLRKAHATLSDPGCRATIASIAESVGCFDPSAFSRAFRSEFGCTPGEVRAAALGGGAVRTGNKSDVLPDITNDFSALLRTLCARQ